MSFKEKCFLVTGGSRGIGAGIAKVLAEKGARVAITYTSRADAAEKVLETLPGDNHFCVALNLNDEASINDAIKDVFERMDKVDGLVNNAGITKDQLLLRMKTEDFDQVIHTNLRGAFLVSKAMIKPMMKARNGSIVNVSSVVGSMGNPGQANYSASKAGLEGMTRSMAAELASRNIRINCVAPGFIQTDMTDELDENQKQAIVQNIPLNQLGTPEDVAHAVAFLLGDDSKYITGQVLHVNGGLYM